MDKEILEGNILIAAFEQRKFYGKHTIDKYGPNTGNEYPEMKYHSSWDWLMPVVEKIQSIVITLPPNYKGYRIEIVVQGYVKIECSPMPPILTNVSREGSLIKAVWQAVVLFIKWYNTNSLTTKQTEQ